jgi:tetratricopeptide (TPR) repeat protein
MLRSIRPKYVVLLLFTAAMGLYCSSLIEITLKPSIIGVDDRSLLMSLLNHRLSFYDIFFVQNPGKYFRPFLGLTFLIDQRVWGEMVFGYRLTNVVLHACNTLLVYAIGRTLLRTQPHGAEASFGASLLFAIHPIAVESVAWISGRTDLLVVFWSLLAFYLYLVANNRNAVYLLPLSLACALAAAFSKETGIMVFILMIGWEIHYRKYFDFEKKRFALFFVLMLLAGGMFYFVLRFNALATRDMSTGMITSRMLSTEVLSSVKLILASYGFYFKKFIFPFPLQFSIDMINVNLYAIVGSVLVLLFIAGMRITSISRYHFYYFWALLGLLPSAVVSVTDIAWTPWAERYLYSSMVPFAIISALLCVQLVNSIQPFPFLRKVAMVCTAIIFIVFGLSSVQRAHMLNDNLSLSQDTYAKSPSFIPAAVFYASSLIDKGMLDKAEQQLHKAELLSGAKHQIFYRLGLLSLSKGNNERAKQYFLFALTEARNDSKLVLMGPAAKKSILLSLSNLEYSESESYTERKTKQRCFQNAVTYLVEAYHEDNSDLFLLYNIAKMYLVMGNNTQAKKYFEEFIKKWHNNDVYKQSAEKLLNKIRFSVDSL